MLIETVCRSCGCKRYDRPQDTPEASGWSQVDRERWVCQRANCRSWRVAERDRAVIADERGPR